MAYDKPTISKDDIRARLKDFLILSGCIFDKYGHFTCPNTEGHAHGDKNPSAYFVKHSSNQGWACLCGAKGDIFTAYEYIYGRKDFSEMFQDLANKLNIGAEEAKIIKTKRYNYHDEAGKVVYVKTRIDFDNGEKTFTFSGVDGKKGLPEGQKHVLYNLPDVVKNRTSQKIFIVEGEKCVDALTSIGLVATSTDTGAGKWDKDYNKYFQDAEVIVLTDNDEPGKKHGELIAKNLKPSTKIIKTILLHGLKKKGDVFDWLQAGHTKDELIEVISNSPEWVPAEQEKDKIRFLNTVDAKTLQGMELPPIRFVINNILSVGLHILAGSPKLGKSWLMIDWGLRISQGLPIWGNTVLKGDVLYLALEDSLNRLQSRMDIILMGKPAPNNFKFAIKAGTLDTGLLKQLDGHMENNPDTVLIIIDTFQKVRGYQGGKENSYSTDYRDAGILKEFADKHGIAVLVIHHLRKMEDLSDPFNGISGSTGLQGAMDSMFVLKKDKRQDSQAVLYGTGRDIEPLEVVIRFDKLSCTWQMVSADVVGFKEEHAFNQDSIVMFVRDFINDGHLVWEGSTSDLFTEMLKWKDENEVDVVDIPISSATFGKRLNELSTKLKKHNILIHGKHEKSGTKISLQYSIGASFTSNCDDTDSSDSSDSKLPNEHIHRDAASSRTCDSSDSSDGILADVLNYDKNCSSGEASVIEEASCHCRHSCQNQPKDVQTSALQVDMLMDTSPVIAVTPVTSYDTDDDFAIAGGTL